VRAEGAEDMTKRNVGLYSLLIEVGLALSSAWTAFLIVVVVLLIRKVVF
jgi:hypothetical protein